ncbi:hypothetical protein ABZU53_12850 [Micromonospora sp. NPDC005194]|uniref:hypothetical protein n=1 Tax=Micromonospora sp. NPDC005194 TaxID=3156870 RepID=UPI0033A4F06F
MTTTNSEELRALRTETIAAIEQRDLLAAQARHELIDALHSGVICRPGCEDAIATWGLEPLSQRWPVSADGELSYTRGHTDADEAREQSRWEVPDELRQLLPGMAIYTRQVVDVTPALDGNDDHPGAKRYRITVQVMVQQWVTATREAIAHTIARTTLETHLPMLADAGISLTRLTWQVADEPDDVTPDSAGRVVGAGELAAASDDIAAVTAVRDAAVQALADLRHRIRVRAIRALVDDEFGGRYEHAAERVGRFLVDLGLDRLPRAHQVTVTADVMLMVAAATASEAGDTAWATMRAITTSSPDESRPWTAYGWVNTEYATADQNRWRVRWRHEYEMWLRGHGGPDDAATVAESLARADLLRALAGVGHDLMTVTASVEGAGIDVNLNPDTD